MGINRAWHLKHKMPKNPTESQREEWHMKHEKKCDCRPMPAKMKEKLLKRQHQAF